MTLHWPTIGNSMKNSFRFILLFLLSNLFYYAHAYSENAFVIDLSTPPSERWYGIIDRYSQEELRQYAKIINENIIETSPILKSTLIRKLINSIGWGVSSNGNTKQWFYDLHSEVKGLSQALKQKMKGESVAGFREEDLFLLNMGYDFSAYCTTGAYLDHSEQPAKPILFRNLDWDIDIFREFTFEVVFLKEGKELFRSINFIGQIGILTGMKSDAFALALNYRKSNDKDYFFKNGFLENIQSALLSGGWSNSLLLRYTLENDNDYNSAKRRISETHLMAPSYFTIVGVQEDQAAIIERTHTSYHQRDFYNRYENPNFIIQTNHDLPIPLYQNEEWADGDPLLSENSGMGTIKRREVAQKYLETLSENSLQSSQISSNDIEASLMNMLSSTTPVFNNQTILSAIISPYKGHFIWNTHSLSSAHSPL